MNGRPLILFDLLTALLDSWSLWNHAAGSPQAGAAWRAEYLRLTYGCGTYQPYETLVAKAAEATGLSAHAPAALLHHWDALEPWPEAVAILNELGSQFSLGVVTNCSVVLGQRAAARLGVPWSTVVTAEEAGYYKPNPRPYQLALDRAGVSPANVVFVAGSGYDLFGTHAVGLKAYWHNRIGLSAPRGAPAADYESASLTTLPEWARRHLLA
jgi:2-haloacid dehalogenase